MLRTKKPRGSAQARLRVPTVAQVAAQVAALTVAQVAAEVVVLCEAVD